MEERRSVKSESNLDSSGNKNFVSKENERVQYAKWFVDHGFAIFPIDPESKKPVIDKWQRYSHEGLTEEEKKRYLELIQKGFNYAIPCGQHNLVVLDFEDKELLKAWIGESVLNEICAKTLCVNTPHGGIHVFLQADEIPEHKFNPAFVKDNKTVMDLQSYNSYVVGPGSCVNHAKCNTDKCPWRGQNYETCYTLYNELRPIGKVDLKGLLKFLADKGKRLGIELSKNARVWLGEKGEAEGEKEDKVKEFEELRKELIKHDSGKSIERIKEEICSKKPPKLVKAIICEGKTYSELGVKDRSITDFRIILYLMENGVTNPDKILELLPPDSKMKQDEKWDVKKYQAVTFVNAWKIAKKKIEAKRKVKTDKSTAKALLIEAIAEEILYTHKLVTFVQRDQLKESLVGLFHFSKKKGIYEPFDVTIERIINKKLEDLEVDFALKTDKSRIVKNIKEEIMRRTQRLLLEEPLRIAFRNGTLEWNEKGVTWYDIKERTPKVYAFHYIDWNLKFEEIEKFMNKEITVEDIEELARRVCPKSLETFKQWVDDKWILLYEVIGYTLYPRYIFNKAILLVGAGANGKSTFLNLLLKILGRKNVSAVPLKRIMEGDRFASIELYHKLANISSELFAFKVTNTDLFKKLTGEDYIEGQKKFKDPVYFINYAKLFNATNELPEVKDQSYGFWRRWIVIEFPHQFEPNPTFFDKTFTDQEVEGVLTVSVLAFIRVLQQKKFDFEDSGADVKEMWERKTDSVYAFVKELLETGKAEYNPDNGDLYTVAEELYNAYVEWCNENDRKAESKATFTQRLQSKFRISKDRKKIAGKRVMCYVGIRLKDTSEEEEDTGDNGQSNDSSNSLLELYNQLQGKVLSRKDLQDMLGLRAYELLEWCEKRNMCHWIDEEHIRFE